MPVNVASAVESVAGLSNLATPQPRVYYILDTYICVPGAQATFYQFLIASGYGYNVSGDQAEYTQAAFYKKCTNAAWWAAISGNFDQNFDPPRRPGAESTELARPSVWLQFDTYQPSDVSDFAQFFGIIGLGGNPSNVTPVHVGVGATPGPNQDEVLLDIDDVMSAAPGAKILVYDAPFTGPGTSFQTIFNQC